MIFPVDQEVACDDIGKERDEDDGGNVMQMVRRVKLCEPSQTGYIPDRVRKRRVKR